MAHLSDLKLSYRLTMEAYPYRQVNWQPAARLRVPLAEARVAVVTTAGFHAPDQPPFDPSVRGGDWSYRLLPADINLDTLCLAHKSDAFDRTGLEQDPNVALPLDRLRELAATGVIAAVAPRHVSLMGSISAPGRLVAESAPAIARYLQADQVDAVLLTPV